MKKFFLLLSLFLLVLPSFVTAQDQSSIAILPVKELEQGKCYIGGCFHEDDDGYLLDTFIHMVITNMSSNESYILPFDRNYRSSKFVLRTYQLPEGKYKISSFVLYLPRNGKNTKTSTDTGFKKIFRGRFQELTLNVNPDLYREFELNAGELLYLGDYETNYFNKFKTDDACRTAKISLMNNYEKFKQEYQLKYPELPLRSSDIREVKSLPVSEESWKNEKAVISGRFIIKSEKNFSFDLYLFNLAMKKRYTIRFLKTGDIRSLEVNPGEYYIESIYFNGSMRYKSGSYDELIPTELLMPFIIKPNEVLYLGGIALISQGKKIGSTYVSDFEIAEPELKDDFGDKYENIRFFGEQL